MIDHFREVKWEIEETSCGYVLVNIPPPDHLANGKKGYRYCVGVVPGDLGRYIVDLANQRSGK